MATAQQKRNWIKRLFRKAVSNGVTFKAQLEMELDAATDAISGGTISATSANGASVTFASSGLTPQHVSDLVGFLDDLHDKAESELERRAETVSDPAIRDEMLAIVGGPVRATYADFSLLGTGYPLS